MLKELWGRFDYEKYGGTPCSALTGGHKGPRTVESGAIDNALKVARDFVNHRGVDLIRTAWIEEDVVWLF